MIRKKRKIEKDLIEINKKLSYLKNKQRLSKF